MLTDTKINSVKYQVIRRERIDEYGHCYLSVMETHDDEIGAIESENDYNENNDNVNVIYYVRIVRP